MLLPDLVTNKKTGKVFVMLDELGERYQLINPEGLITSLPMTLFDEELIEAEMEELWGMLSDEQRDKYIELNDEADKKAAEEARIKQITKGKVSVKKVASQASKPRSPGSSTQRGKIQKPDGRTGVAASWEGDTLSFYKPQIDRMGLTQRMQIIVRNVGLIELTKQEFQKHFIEVVLSPEYKSTGFYRYLEFPEKAKKFVKG